jgi:hypothetical protein
LNGARLGTDVVEVVCHCGKASGDGRDLGLGHCDLADSVRMKYEHERGAMR